MGKFLIYTMLTIVCIFSAVIALAALPFVVLVVIGFDIVRDLRRWLRGSK